MTVQTSVSKINPIGQAGALASLRTGNIRSRVAAGSMAAGRGAFKVPGAERGEDSVLVNAEPGRAWQNPSPSNAADVDAIITSIGSTTGVQSFTTAHANGVVGDDEMQPGRKLTLVLSSHADWDATTATIRYVDYLTGLTVSESLSIPNGGNTTLTTAGLAKSFVSLSIPAQSGTGGTATVGIAALDASVTAADFLGVVVRKAMNVMASVDSGYDFEDGDTVGLLCSDGEIWVVTEDACTEGGDVYCRVGGSGSLGAFRSDSDSSTAVQVARARWGRNSAIGGLNVLEMY